MWRLTILSLKCKINTNAQYFTYWGFFTVLKGFSTHYILETFDNCWNIDLRSMKCDNSDHKHAKTVTLIPEYELTTYKMQICVLVANFSDLEGTLYVVKNAGQVPVREEDRRLTRPEALPGSRLYIWRCDQVVGADPCDLRGCFRHFEISATVQSRTVASGWTLSRVLLLQPS
jgi:hypothetical protein